MRVSAYIALIIIAFTMPFWLFVLGVMLYIARWYGGELLIIAACVDVVFGTDGVAGGFLYTLVTAGIFLGATFLKPRLRVYQDLV